MSENNTLAIIKEFGIGIGDYGQPAIWFSTYIREGISALQVIHGAEQIHEFIANCGLPERVSLTALNGKPCWVDASNGFITFVKVAKL